MVNLRGVRESGIAFATPTYVFIFSMFALIVGRASSGASDSCPQVTDVPDPVPVGHRRRRRAFS